MTGEEAASEAKKMFGEGTTLHREKNGWCKVQDDQGKTLGHGQTWLEALRMAAMPILKAEEQKRATAQRQAELQRRADMAEFERFLTFLREHLKEPYLEWRKARDAENAKKLAEQTAAPTEKPTVTL